MFGVMLIDSVGNVSGEKNVIFNKYLRNIYCTPTTCETLSRVGEPVWIILYLCFHGAWILVGGYSYLWRIGSIFKGRERKEVISGSHCPFSPWLGQKCFVEGQEHMGGAGLSLDLRRGSSPWKQKEERENGNRCRGL